MKLNLEGESATTALRKPKNGAISLSLNFDDIFPGKKRSREGWNSDSVSSLFALSPRFLSKLGRVMYIANLIGFGLAVASSAFIGYSFIIKKKGLQRASASGCRARHICIHDFSLYGYECRWADEITIKRLIEVSA